MIRKLMFAASVLAVLALITASAAGQSSPKPLTGGVTVPVQVVNQPNVNVANTPSVNVANTPSVSVTNAPSVDIANTPTVNLSAHHISNAGPMLIANKLHA